MKIENAVVLVTGANRGIGLAFARELLARGARKVYAGARDPATVTQPGVHALQLDVNRPQDVAAAAALASDVTLVINNAGIAQPGGFMAPDSEEVARRILDRKSTRLNSSHLVISYAVFCLKKKNKLGIASSRGLAAEIRNRLS